MKKKMVSVLLAAAMGTTALVGFGSTAYAADDVLEFYHGYYQDESEWAAAQVMRDIYDEFAKEHADGSVTFKPIAVFQSIVLFHNSYNTVIIYNIFYKIR